MMAYKYKKGPRVEIDQTQFENLCKIHCTLIEIAGWFKCSEDTIEAWCEYTYDMRFTDVYKNFSSEGKISLRRTQFRMAETNCSMAIWLGKQYLDQKDNDNSAQHDLGMLPQLLGYFKEAGANVHTESDKERGTEEES